jgi:hypothetical protein
MSAFWVDGVNQNAMWEFAIEQRSRCLGAGHSEAMLLSASPNLPFVENCRVRKFLTMRRTANLKPGLMLLLRVKRTPSEAVGIVR